jgi:Fic family protein
MERSNRSAVKALVDFFNSNPDEELTIDDATAKMDCSRITAANALSHLSGTDYLERVTIYRRKSPPGGVRVAE